MTSDHPDFVPRIPSISDAESIEWCHLLDGVVHVGSWTRGHGGWLITLTEDEDKVQTCFGQTQVARRDLRPWRDRKLLTYPVCLHCVAQVHRFEDIADP